MALWIWGVGLLCSVPSVAGAQVMMTEVMYDLEGTDTGREWIEVYNAGSSPVDMADWKLFEANTSHRLTAESASVIPAQGFAIIADNTAKFLTDNPSFSGVLFDSTFSLSNEGETLILRDGSGTDIDSVTYSSAMGAAGDGKSLQKNGSNWIAILPTPGAMTSGNAPPASGSVTTETTTSASSTAQTNSGIHDSHSSQSVANESTDNVVLEVTSGRDRLGFVGVPLSFEARVKSPRDLPATYVSHRWSLGDGSQSSGQFISHTYVYPGDYVVILNSEHGGDKAVSKIRVRIVSPQISIREANQNFIELLNEGRDELNLGGWALETHGGRFVIPQDTIVLPRQSIRIPLTATKLNPINDVSLINPSATVLAHQVVSGGASALGSSSGEQIVVMNGLTEDMIRSQFAMAMQAQREMRNTPSVASIAKVIPTPVAVVAQIPTSTQSAAVIYTVGQNSKTRGFFGKLLDFFTR